MTCLKRGRGYSSGELESRTQLGLVVGTDTKTPDRLSPQKRKERNSHRSVNASLEMVAQTGKGAELDVAELKKATPTKVFTIM